VPTSGKTGEKWEITLLDFDPNETVLLYQVLDVCAKFYQNLLNVVTMRARTDRQTDRQTHTERMRDDMGDG